MTGHIVVGFAGTNGWNDLVADLITQPLGLSSQYAQAVALGRQALAFSGSAGMLSVGHSLGGGLAAAAALATSTNAVTMNAAGISWLTAAVHGLPLGNAINQITAWSHEGEILTNFINPLPLVPNTNGTINNLPAGPNAGYPISRHVMDSVQQSISNQMINNGCFL